MNDATPPNELNPASPAPAAPHERSVDGVLRAAATRQRRALTPASDDAASRLTLHGDGPSAPMPMPAAGRRWRSALAAAAALALCAGGWWALSAATDSPPPGGPIAIDTPDPSQTPASASRGINALLAGARAALDAPLNLPALPALPAFPQTPDVTNPLGHLTANLTADRMTQPLTDELDRMRADVRRVLNDLPRVSLRWDQATDDESRTDRAAPHALPSA